MGKDFNNWPDLGYYLTYRIHIKVQPIQARLMTQMPMTLTFGQIFPKMSKNTTTGHISEAISPTDFILGTKVQPNKAHSMTQVPMTMTQCQRSRSNFPQNG